jgi:polyhydroxyalkanoate synthesis regulator phasin
MKKGLAIFVLGLFFLLLLGGASLAVEITNPILKKLVEKGVLTQEEAMSVMQEMEQDTVEQEKRIEEKIDKKSAEQEKLVEEKIDKKVTEVKSAEGEDVDKVLKALKKFKIGFLWYLSYQNGQNGKGSGEDYSRFLIKRGYINIYYKFTPWFKVRVTPDVNMMEDDENNFDGSFALRLKYMYGQFNLPDYSIFTKPFVEVGMVHMPWLDYEEHVNFYRCQGTMFLERNHIFNSADLGVTAVSLFGGMMDEEYQHNVNHYYAGRYGSVALGVYNGGGYHASEENENKPFEGRLTIRPLPDIIPGLQLSYFGIYGKGNNDTEPDWTVNLPFVSYEHEYVTLTGQYYRGTGNQKGTDEYKKDGYSFFTEIKPIDKFSIIGRYDYFNENKDVDDADNVRYIAGIAYHFYKQHKNMLLLDYDHVDYKDPLRKDDKRLQLTLQIKL